MQALERSSASQKAASTRIAHTLCRVTIMELGVSTLDGAARSGRDVPKPRKTSEQMSFILSSRSSFAAAMTSVTKSMYSSAVDRSAQL